MGDYGTVKPNAAYGTEIRFLCLDTFNLEQYYSMNQRVAFYFRAVATTD